MSRGIWYYGIRVVCYSLILSVFYIQHLYLVTRQDASELVAIKNQSVLLKESHERKAVLWSIAMKEECIKPKDDVSVVGVLDLVRTYKDDRAVADMSYTNHQVVVVVRNYVVKGREVYWHFGSVKIPPVAIFTVEEDFQGKLPDVLWIQGKCEGAILDNQKREFTGYNFHVKLVDCKILKR